MQLHFMTLKCLGLWYLHHKPLIQDWQQLSKPGDPIDAQSLAHHKQLVHHFLVKIGAHAGIAVQDMDQVKARHTVLHNNSRNLYVHLSGNWGEKVYLC